MKAFQNEIDEHLLVEAAQKDPSRFAGLYELNFERVYAFVARRVALRQEAEDLTAEVFQQALASIGRYEDRGLPFVGWLLGIASHLIAQRWRRSAAEPQAQVDTMNDIGINDNTEQRAMLFQLVNSLPSEQREVIMARFVDQRSIREIAQELQRSEGAVKQLQFRALQTLRMKVRKNHV